MADACTFCAIVAGEVGAHVVMDEDAVFAFLDQRPLFPGHVLVVPRAHHETLLDVPASLVAPVFDAVRRTAAAVTAAMAAEGSFVALNNVVSQSVPHLHVHVVPRTKGDGLRGFFWPRQRYRSGPEMAEVAARIAGALRSDGQHRQEAPTARRGQAPRDSRL
ncbi:MAG: HIT family protein [Actinomycetota bacterium]|nr:HIT family protein [Actinomycetota bacterium]